MNYDDVSRILSRVVLAVGPIVVLGAVFGVLYLTFPFETIGEMTDAGLFEMLWVLGIIGAIAGIIPVAIGMLWFPFIRDLDRRYLHAFLSLAAGVLVFIAIEMTAELLEQGAFIEQRVVVVVLAMIGIGGTFFVMYGVSRWRQQTMMQTEKSGLEIAYLVAIALGLHSIGEGLGIGVAFVQGDVTLVTLLVLAFIIHNVMEGPTIVAAVARDRDVPPLKHFAAMGVLAGGPVILGGWIGSFAQSPLLAVLFFAIAIGAIVQVLIEVVALIRFDTDTVLTRVNAVTFGTGFLLMFLLEDVITELVLEGWLIGG